MSERFAGPPDPETRSPAPSAKGNRAKSHRQAEAQENYRNHSEKSTSLKVVSSFHACDGRIFLGVIRDLAVKVEALDPAGRSLGFFISRTEALRALGGAR